MSNLLVDSNELKKYCADVFARSIPREEAELVADNLVEGDLLGFYSHGVTKVSDYIKRMEDGLIEKKTDLKLVNETRTTGVFNASNGWGQYASVKAMDKAIEKAKEYGVGFVGVRGSNHFGITSYYTKLAAEQNCIGIAMTNASGLMVPFGSREPSLGTNPISISVPVGEGKDPIVLDMSTGNTARGKITLANKTGESIPLDWAITKDGKPTDDPAEALEGFLLPMGPKGSGLAIMVDILSGVLTGALFGKEVPRMYEDPEPQNLGHFFGAIDIGAFMDLEAFKDRMIQRVAHTVNSAPMEGFDRVTMPGQLEMEKKKKQLQDGIPLPKEIYEELRTTGAKYGVDIDLYTNLLKGRNVTNA